MYNNQEYNQYDNALMNIQIILKESQMQINHIPFNAVCWCMS